MVVTRSQSRADERGAAVFIVVMVITLLTGIGVFAIRSASLVSVASGHARQGVQTMHLAEYATRAAVVEVGSADRSGAYVRQIMRSREPGSQETCVANRNVLETLHGKQDCYLLQQDEIAERVDGYSPGQQLLEPQTAAADGSLGPRLGTAGDVTSALDGVFRVEMLELHTTGTMAGFDSAQDTGFATMTLTTYAQTRMVGSGGTEICASDEAAPSASLRAMRATITVLALL